MICLRSESQKHYIFPSNLFFMLRKFPTSSGRRGYKSHKFKTWNTIFSENTIDLKSRKDPGYKVAYSHSSRKLFIGLSTGEK